MPEPIKSILRSVIASPLFRRVLVFVIGALVGVLSKRLGFEVEGLESKVGMAVDLILALLAAGSVDAALRKLAELFGARKTEPVPAPIATVEEAAAALSKGAK